MTVQYLDSIGENNARDVVCTFKDEDGAAAIPSTVHWRVTCPDDDSVITDYATATAVTGVGPDGYSEICTVTISVPSTAHERVTTLERERRILIVVADKDTDDEFNEEFHYYIEHRSAR